MFRATPKEVDLRRRQLLRGDPTANHIPRRPPWARPESLFIERCTRCDDCIHACEDALLQRGSGGYPEIHFDEAGCDFCGECLKACTTGALDAPFPAPSLAWTWKPEISASCLSLRGIVCRACGDACDAEAIRFQLQVGGRARPGIDTNACNGCGECLAVCPEGAVALRVPETETSTKEECR